MPGTNHHSRRPWQVIRIHHNGGVTPVASFRNETLAALVAGAYDMASVIVRRGSSPRWHYDVRRTLRPAPRFCVHVDADTSNPATAVHDTSCPRHPDNQEVRP